MRWFVGPLSHQGGTGVDLSMRAGVIEYRKKTSEMKSCLVSANKANKETVKLHRLSVSDLFLLQLSPIARLSMRNES